MIRFWTLLLLAAIAQAQTGPDAPADSLSSVMLERRIALQRLQLSLGDKGLPAGPSWFERYHRRTVPTAYAPALAVLTRARHAIGPGGGGELEGEPLADALDLRCIPGAFDPSPPEAKRQPITVHVTPLYPTPVPAEAFQLVLVWQGPRGEEVEARRESVEPRAVQAAGFEMYVQAPPSEPGTWWLSPRVVIGNRTAQGFPVPVECVADLEARFPALQKRDPAAARAVRSLLETGARDPQLPSIEDLLAGKDSPRERGFSLEGFELGDHELVAIEPEPSAEVQATLLAVAPSSERASWLFAGPALDGWREFARTERVRVLSTDLPIFDVAGPDARALIDALRAREPGRPILLLARGPVMSELAMALHAGMEPCFDALVQSSFLMQGAHPTALAPRPTLFVEVLAPEAQEPEPVEIEGSTSFYHARTPGPPIFADLELPSHIAAWLRARAEVNGSSGR